jgi:acid stress chaperone HdeB
MRYRALVVAVVLIAAASAPAAAQIKLDMNQITCGDWLGYGQRTGIS